jgi:hypothetical protein
MDERVYELNTLQDIVDKVPADRIPQCMADIAEGLAHMAVTRAVEGRDCRLLLPIVWTDDDEDDVLVRYEMRHIKEGA